MLFREIIGLEEVKEKLIHSVRKDQLAHAILLAGERGALHLPMALAFATFLNCTNRSDTDACGECASCSKNLKFIHPDLNFVFPVTTKAGLKPKEIISQSFLQPWRAFLKEKPYASEDTWATYLESEDKQFNISKEESRQIISNLSLKPFEGEYKIMLIWLPEYMHPSAANGILKILEEPAAKTVFLLVTNSKEKLLSTILSRILTVPVRRLNNKELVSTLVQQHDFVEEKANQIARTADGSLELGLNQSVNNEDEVIAAFRDWLLLCHKFDRPGLVRYTEKFNSLNKLSQRSFMHYGNSVLREVLVQQVSIESIARYAPQEENFIKRLAVLLNNRQIEDLFEYFNGLIYDLERNVNPKIAFLDVSLKVAILLKKK